MFGNATITGQLIDPTVNRVQVLELIDGGRYAMVEFEDGTRNGFPIEVVRMDPVAEVPNAKHARCGAYDANNHLANYSCDDPAVRVLVHVAPHHLMTPVCAAHWQHLKAVAPDLFIAELVPVVGVAHIRAIKQFGLSWREIEDVAMTCFRDAHNGKYLDFDYELERPITDMASLAEAAAAITYAYLEEHGPHADEGYRDGEEEHLTFELCEAMNKKLGSRWRELAEDLANLSKRTGLTPLAK